MVVEVKRKGQIWNILEVEVTMMTDQLLKARQDSRFWIGATNGLSAIGQDGATADLYRERREEFYVGHTHFGILVRHPKVKVKEVDVQVELWKERQSHRNAFWSCWHTTTLQNLRPRWDYLEENMEGEETKDQVP